MNFFRCRSKLCLTQLSMFGSPICSKKNSAAPLCLCSAFLVILYLEYLLIFLHIPIYSCIYSFNIPYVFPDNFLIFPLGVSQDIPSTVQLSSKPDLSNHGGLTWATDIISWTCLPMANRIWHVIFFTFYASFASKERPSLFCISLM